MSLQELLQCGAGFWQIGCHSDGSAEPLFSGTEFAELFSNGGDFESFLGGGRIANDCLLCC